MPSKLSIGVSTPFQKQYPQITEFFTKVDLPIDPLTEALADMSEKHTAPRQAAEAFMKAHPDGWPASVPKDVADKVSAELK